MKPRSTLEVFDTAIASCDAYAERGLTNFKEDFADWNDVRTGDPYISICQFMGGVALIERSCRWYWAKRGDNDRIAEAWDGLKFDLANVGCECVKDDEGQLWWQYMKCPLLLKQDLMKIRKAITGD